MYTAADRRRCCLPLKICLCFPNLQATVEHGGTDDQRMYAAADHLHCCLPLFVLMYYRRPPLSMVARTTSAS
jgi:hypothetical protein